jgi:hypothetical protein
LTIILTKLLKLLITDDPKFIGVLYGDAFTGQKQVTRVGYPTYSYFVNKQVYDANGNPIEGLYVDLSGLGGTVNGNNADKYIYHNPAPDYVLAFSARFAIKTLIFPLPPVQISETTYIIRLLQALHTTRCIRLDTGKISQPS